jgi:cytochrome c551/c552
MNSLFNLPFPAKKILLGCSLAGLIWACVNNREKESAIQEEKVEHHTLNAVDLISTYCITCHQPAHATVAPSFIEIKHAYQTAYPNESDFVGAMVNFILQPSDELSIIPQSIEKYGRMTKLAYKLADLEKIAQFIYSTDPAHPQWLEKETIATTPNSPLERGLQASLQTKAVLGKNLLAAIQQGGHAHAVEFCKTRALALTDSMSTHLGLQIHRITDKPRNPANQASARELAYMATMKAQIEMGDEPKALLDTHQGITRAYYAITTETMCLQCHGDTKKDIAPATLKKIQGLYPHDKATGYSAMALRGMWRVEFQ